MARGDGAGSSRGGPQGAGAWGWFLGRCLLFSVVAHATVGVLAQIAQRRLLRGAGAGKPGSQESAEASNRAAQPYFDVPAYEATAAVLLFHVGPPLWLWVFA